MRQTKSRPYDSVPAFSPANAAQIAFAQSRLSWAFPVPLQSQRAQSHRCSQPCFPTDSEAPTVCHSAFGSYQCTEISWRAWLQWYDCARGKDSLTHASVRAATETVHPMEFLPLTRRHLWCWRELHGVTQLLFAGWAVVCLPHAARCPTQECLVLSARRGAVIHVSRHCWLSPEEAKTGQKPRDLENRPALAVSCFFQKKRALSQYPIQTLDYGPRLPLVVSCNQASSLGLLKSSRSRRNTQLTPNLFACQTNVSQSCWTSNVPYSLHYKLARIPVLRTREEKNVLACFRLEKGVGRVDLRRICKCWVYIGASSGSRQRCCHVWRTSHFSNFSNFLTVSVCQSSVSQHERVLPIFFCFPPLSLYK